MTKLISWIFIVKDIYHCLKDGMREIANSPESTTRIPSSYISDSKDRSPLTNESFCIAERGEFVVLKLIVAGYLLLKEEVLMRTVFLMCYCCLGTKMFGFFLFF